MAPSLSPTPHPDCWCLPLPVWEGQTSGVAKLGHTGARALATGGCAPPVQALLKIINALSIMNRALKLEIELRSIAILVCSPALNVCLFAVCVYYSDLELRAHVRSEGIVECFNSRQQYGLK